MGRIPCCDKESVKRGQWTPEEDNKLSSYIAQHGTRNWRLIPKNAGLQRCGKSCRLRWTNYLRPDLKREDFSESEEDTIIRLHSVVGNRWSLIAGQLPGRTDNDVKNYWNTKLKKKLSGMGIDPVTHKPFSHLMAEIATTLHPPQVAHLAEAALGCFKDEMLHLLTKKRSEYTVPPPPPAAAAAALVIGESSMSHATPPLSSVEDNNNNNNNNRQETIEMIKQGLSRAILEDKTSTAKPWAATSRAPYDLGDLRDYPAVAAEELHLGESELWNMPSLITTRTEHEQQQRANLTDHDEEEEEEEEEGATCGRQTRKEIDTAMFSSDYVFWDLSDDLMNSIL